MNEMGLRYLNKWERLEEKELSKDVTIERKRGRKTTTKWLFAHNPSSKTHRLRD
jgi:hypothetical protein